MANVCVYHAIIKGRRNNIYCMASALPTMDDFQFVDEYGTDEKATLLVKGNCKWTLSAYTGRNNELTSIDVPEDLDKAQLLGYELVGTDYNQLAELLNVSMFTAEFDADDFMGVNTDIYGKKVNLSETENEFLDMQEEVDFYGVSEDDIYDGMDNFLDDEDEDYDDE